MIFVRKVNGVWKQSVGLAFTGENGNVQFDSAVDPTQEEDVTTSRFEIKTRGNSHNTNGATKRKIRRFRRRMKKQGLL